MGRVGSCQSRGQRGLRMSLHRGREGPRWLHGEASWPCTVPGASRPGSPAGGRYHATVSPGPPCGPPCWTQRTGFWGGGYWWPGPAGGVCGL